MSCIAWIYTSSKVISHHDQLSESAAQFHRSMNTKTTFHHFQIACTLYTHFVPRLSRWSLAHPHPCSNQPPQHGSPGVSVIYLIYLSKKDLLYFCISFISTAFHPDQCWIDPHLSVVCPCVRRCVQFRNPVCVCCNVSMSQCLSLSLHTYIYIYMYLWCGMCMQPA